MPEPTPPLDLDAIEAQDCNLAHMCDCHDHVPALLARVRALEAAVRDVAAEEPWTYRSSGDDFVCFYCEQWRWEPHAPDCTWIACRALLGVSEA